MAGAAAVAFSRSARRAWAPRRAMIARHLIRVMGSDAPAPASAAMGRLVDDTIASYARYWAESLRIPALGRRRLEAGVRYDGFSEVEAGRAAGRGTILVLPHLGGWEWAGAQLAASGYPVSVVVERLHPDDLFEWFVSFRERLGMHVIPAGPGAAARCSAALAGNHLLCLLSDRLIEGTSGVDVDFFGERTQLPAGPATLALRTGARLVPCAVYFEPRTEQHRGVLHPAIDAGRRPTARGGAAGGSGERRGGLRADITRLTQDVAGHLETFIRAAPTQWHLMQPNWPSDR